MKHIYKEDIVRKSIENPESISVGDIIQIHKADGSELLLHVVHNRGNDKCFGCLFYDNKEECPRYYMKFKRYSMHSHTVEEVKVGTYSLCTNRSFNAMYSNLVFKSLDSILENL